MLRADRRLVIIDWEGGRRPRVDVIRELYAQGDQVGEIARSELPVLVNANDGTNVIGMNFLSSLQSWRVEGNYLVMKP